MKVRTTNGFVKFKRNLIENELVWNNDAAMALYMRINLLANYADSEFYYNEYRVHVGVGQALITSATVHWYPNFDVSTLEELIAADLITAKQIKIGILVEVVNFQPTGQSNPSTVIKFKSVGYSE